MGDQGHGVRVSAHDGVGVQKAVTLEDHAGQVLEVYLMDNTRAGRHDAEVVEGVRTPLQELESLSVSVELELLILLAGILGTSKVDGN